MSENQVAEATPKAKRPPPEVTKVQMEDGREVSFTGKVAMLKDLEAGSDGVPVAVRFDFRNGVVRRWNYSDSPLLLQLAGHGAKQKIGDATAKAEDVDDMVLAVEDMISRLDSGNFNAERAAGDGFSGASVVIRAVMEATGKSQAEIKAWLESKLEAAKAAGQQLTRNDLYQGFRKPGTKTAAIIARLEEEKRAKAAKLDGDELLNELG